MRILWLPSALEDLEGIIDYVGARDRDAASTIFSLITGNVSALAEQPFMGRAGRVEGTRELVIAGTPYLIAYELQNETVNILAVLHGARRWPDSFG